MLKTLHIFMPLGAWIYDEKFRRDPTEWTYLWGHELLPYSNKIIKKFQNIGAFSHPNMMEKYLADPQGNPRVKEKVLSAAFSIKEEDHKSLSTCITLQVTGRLGKKEQSDLFEFLEDEFTIWADKYDCTDVSIRKNILTLIPKPVDECEMEISEYIQQSRTMAEPKQLHRHEQER